MDLIENNATSTCNVTQINCCIQYKNLFVKRCNDYNLILFREDDLKSYDEKIASVENDIEKAKDLQEKLQKQLR